MAWPPPTQAVDAANATAAVDEHPARHNALAAAINSDLVPQINAKAPVDGRGTLAARPAAGIAGRRYITTDDIQAEYRDNASSWDQVSQGLLEAALLKAYKAGVLTATRHGVNFIQGANVTITTADNVSLDATDVTIAAPPGSTLVRKTADETVTGSITLQDDNHLLIALVANEIKAFRIVVFYDGSVGGDINFGFTVPSLATGTFGVVALQTAATTATDSARFSSQALVGGSVGAGCAGVGTKLDCIISGLVINGANAGNLQLQWAQRVSDGANATRVYADSYLVA